MAAAVQPITTGTRLEGPVQRATPATIRLLVVDDHPAVRSSLRRLLQEERDFELVDVVSGAETALATARREAIDVAVVDYQLGAGHDGLWLSRKLKRLPAPPKVLIYSAYCDVLLTAAAVVAQADGVLTKGGLGSELCHAIRSVSRAALPLPIAPRQLEETIRNRLGDEEQIVFGMLLNGIALQQIAALLDYPMAQLEVRLSRMLGKLEAVPLSSNHAHRSRPRRRPREKSAWRQVPSPPQRAPAGR